MMLPSEHEAYNTIHYPGTRQLCFICDEPTERCEDDACWSTVYEGEPLCADCWHEENPAEVE